MSNLIIGTAGHIDHGKTALIHAINGYEGDETKEEKQRGITIDLSFSNLQRGSRNIAFIDVPGHEKLVKNMIAGAFGFDAVMLIVSAAEGIMPQTVEHIEIINLLGIKNIILTLTKKDLVDEDTLKQTREKTLKFLEEFDFDIVFVQEVSIYDEQSIETLKDKLFTLDASAKPNENFFRYYVDRVFSPKGIGTVVTGTILGKPLLLNEEVFICEAAKKSKIKNIQVHGENAIEAGISSRAALNLQGVNIKDIHRGSLISKKGFLRGFKNIDISFKALKDKEVHHNRVYSCFIGSKKLDVKVLIYDCDSSTREGIANIKANSEIFSIFGEKLILREGNDTIAGGVVLNPINDPMKKPQKKKMLEFLAKGEITNAYSVLLEAHKKGLGLISSAQRFALSHEEAITYAKELDNAFVDETDLVIYPISTKDIIKNSIKDIYSKNTYALLSITSVKLRLKWASENFIKLVMDELISEEFLIQDNNLYKNANITEDFMVKLEQSVLQRLENEGLTPTAPYNIYDELDLDRKMGDDILKSLCAKKKVQRLQSNVFIHTDSLNQLVLNMRAIMKTEGYIDIKNFKEKYPMSRKYLVTYLDYLDKFGDVKKEDQRRVLMS
ncbi:MAG: selenocysteine-specific translation elongation factor [Campylobacteraceae bacterium]|nr:selenocysteine-specific translation elongation factor [Campylobacteraceae bacterium]